jgi:hypothetical protein
VGKFPQPILASNILPSRANNIHIPRNTSQIEIPTTKANITLSTVKLKAGENISQVA